jgi:hypothetical protein
MRERSRGEHRQRRCYGSSMASPRRPAAERLPAGRGGGHPDVAYLISI